MDKINLILQEIVEILSRNSVPARELPPVTWRIVSNFLVMGDVYKLMTKALHRVIEFRRDWDCQVFLDWDAEDVYQDFWVGRNKLDNSDYPKKSQYFNKTNKKVIGKFKDDAAGIPRTEVTGLRSKMYSYVKDNNGKGAW